MSDKKLWIDGEFFDNPVILAKSERVLNIANFIVDRTMEFIKIEDPHLRFLYGVQTSNELEILKTSDIFQRRRKGKGIGIYGE